MIFKLCFNFYMWIGVIKCLVEAKGDVVFNDPNILVMKGENIHKIIKTHS